MWWDDPLGHRSAKFFLWDFGKIFNKNPKSFKEVVEDDRIRDGWLSVLFWLLLIGVWVYFQKN